MVSSACGELAVNLQLGLSCFPLGLLCAGAVELAMLVVGRLCLGFGIVSRPIGGAVLDALLPLLLLPTGATFAAAAPLRRCALSQGFVNQVAPLYLSEMAPLK